MITANATMVGTISQQAQMKQTAQGACFYSVPVQTSIPQREGDPLNTTIWVSAPQSASLGIEALTVGQKVSIKGTLRFRKDGDLTYLNLQATEMNVVDATQQNSLLGILHFIGSLRSKLPEVKVTKTGKSMMSFSAYSGDGEGEKRTYTWVRFSRFSSEIDSFLVPKAMIEAVGAMELTYFQGKLFINCRLSELKPYVRQAPKSAPF